MSTEPDLPLYDFTPAPSARDRHDGWTPPRQRRFVTLLALTGSVTHAARAVGMSAVGAYKLRRRAGAESFAAAWNSALEEARLRAYDRAVDFSINGIERPRYYRGKRVGTARVFDYRLALAALGPNPYARLSREEEAAIHAFQAHVGNFRDEGG